MFESFTRTWPMAGVHQGEFTVVVQLPIAPDDPQGQKPELRPLGEVWIGRESEEIWLLVRDLAEYPEDLLPA